MKNAYRISEDGTYAIVELTQGQVTLVDIEDLPIIAEYQWNASWNPDRKSYYATANIRLPSGKKTSIRLNRLVMNAQHPFVVDHINTVTLDNRKSNLRICTKSENGMNRGKQSNNTTGHKGICFSKSKNRYVVHIKKDGKSKYIGGYENYEDAVIAHEQALEKMHGDFSRIEDSTVMDKVKIQKPDREPKKEYMEGYGEVYRIPLSNGQFAIFDIDDYDLVVKYTWCAVWNKCTKTYYASTNIRSPEKRGQTMHMQRAIMDAPKGMFVDHINHDSLDNRRCNLRLTTKSENMMNRRKLTPNASGLKGVYKKSKNKWYSKIKANGQEFNLGTFDTAEEAHAAYCTAALELHGEFACLE